MRNILEFKYQHYWLRMFFLLPLVVIMPLIEYELLYDVFASTFYFYLFCTVVTFIIAYGLYRHTSRFFTRTGSMTIEGSNIYIERGRKKSQLSGLSKVELEQKRLYGTQFALLTITYLSQGKEEMYSIVSEDLDVETFEKCSLWKCYEALQQMAEENDR